MTRREQAERLLRRAEALEATLARALQDLNPDMIARFSETVLELGIIDNDRLAAIFEAATSRTLESSYLAFAADSAAIAGLPNPVGWIRQEAAGASDLLVRELTRQGRQSIEAAVQRATREGWSVQRLTTVIQKDLGLTQQQLRWVENFEQKLRTNPAKAMGNALRDRRFDRTLARGGDLSEAQIQRQVERYREKWTRYRAGQVARVELLRASNSANYAAWADADTRGEIPRMVRKFWWHAHDAHVRDSHVQIPIINPFGVPIREAFVTPLGRLRYPLDPMGAPADVIGCRCAVVFDTSTPGAGL
jgi:hypothetical protein